MHCRKNLGTKWWHTKENIWPLRNNVKLSILNNYWRIKLLAKNAKTLIKQSINWEESSMQWETSKDYSTIFAHLSTTFRFRIKSTSRTSLWWESRKTTATILPKQRKRTAFSNWIKNVSVVAAILHPLSAHSKWRVSPTTPPLSKSTARNTSVKNC
jgi:hypothetical protein